MVQPIDNRQKLINQDGTPTEYFIRVLRDRGLSADSTATEAQLATKAIAALSDNNIVAGVGLDGGGSLSLPNIAIDLNASIGDLNDVTLSPPPAGGNVLKYDIGTNQWTPGVVGGGGSFRGAFGVVQAAGGTFEYNSAGGIILPPGWLLNTGSMETVAQTDTPISTTHALTFNPSTGLGSNANRQLTINGIVSTPGSFTIRYQTQGEPGWDGIQVFVDGVNVVDRRATDTTFLEYTTTLGVGSHQVGIRYFSDGAIAGGYQNVRLSRIVLPFNAGSQPYGYGDTVTYEGRTYFCLTPETTATPAVGSADWAVFANV